MGRQTGSSAGLDADQALTTCAIRSPPFAYAQLELVTDGPAALELDNLIVRSYCTSALRQFLGLSGVAISIDILKADGSDCWVRVPRQDLGAFSAALTAWKGTKEDGSHCLLRVKQCSDWLGPMVGSNGQDEIWRC